MPTVHTQSCVRGDVTTEVAGNVNGNVQAHVNVEPPSPVNNALPLVEMPVLAGGSPSCAKIALIDVDGVLLNQDLTGLMSMGENPVALFREKLEYVQRNGQYRAVILRINSPGGGVTATDIMWRDLRQFKEATGLPVVACLMDLGTGGAYYLATGADAIVAHPTTITGGMGVILNAYNLQDAMNMWNIVGVPIKSGSKIDIGSPVREMSEECRGILQAVADHFHHRFQDVVLRSRTQYKPIDKEGKEKDFDGRIFTAEVALEKHLIDSIGYLDDAVEIACQHASSSDASVVMLHRPNDHARSPYAVTPNTPLQGSLLPINIPGLQRAELPTFFYMWQPLPGMERLGR